MTFDLFAKYDRPVPRYTSYPPVPFWNGPPTEANWISHLDDAMAMQDSKLDLYVHIPYCESLCYYCGCARTITKDKSRGADYVSLLITEWKLYLEKLKYRPTINSLHFGGGTPNFLRPQDLDTLLNFLSQHFSADFIGSIELDPRTVTSEHLNVLNNYSFQRISLGIQDFNLEVQKAIHRIQPFSLVDSLVSTLRRMNFKSINFDLIYGLPKQNHQTIKDTIQSVLALAPDLMACYSYAHLPEKMANQKLIHSEDLTNGQDKRRIFEIMSENFISANYQAIGMDHFGLPTSYLCQAKAQAKLHRNFMGYIDHKSDVLLGLGITSISQSPNSFMQNSKRLEDYVTHLKMGELPIEHGHHLSALDREISKQIQKLFCYETLNYPELRKLPHFEQMSDSLATFEQENILYHDNKLLQLTMSGRPFLRSVAALLDPHLQGQFPSTRFSQSI